MGPQGDHSRPHYQPGAGKKRARLRFNSARRVSLQNGNPTTRQNVERRCPTTPPGRIKTQTYGFFRAGRALSRPRRRANRPSAAPDVAQTQINPARAPHLAAPERGRLIAQELRLYIPSKARVLMRKARRRDVHWSTWAPVERGASGSATCARGAVPRPQVWPGRCVLKRISPGPTPQRALQRGDHLAADIPVGHRHSD